VRAMPKLQIVKDLIPVSAAARLLPPKRGDRVHRGTILRWGDLPGDPPKGTYRVYAANGWKVSRSEFLAWAARTSRLAPHVLIAG
jgi:hypothetical protein